MRRPIRRINRREVEAPVRSSRGHDYSSVASRIRDVQKIKKPLRVALYGRSGSGKTTLACTFPKTLLLDIKDEGTDSVTDVPGLKAFAIETWDDLEQAYWFLAEADHDFESVAIDTVTQMQDLAVREVVSQNKKNEKEAGNWGTLSKREWGEVSTMLKTWVTNFRNLPMNVVFIAQERVFNVDEESDTVDGAIMPEVGPRLMPSVASTLNAAVDLIGNCFVRETITRTRNKEKKLVETRKTQYCLRIGPHSVYVTKVRKPKSVEVPSFLVDAEFDDLIELQKQGA